ncbi:MAG: right-handed parallel beta-helix repeat-containing protein [Flavobacteriales bacterium]|nr:right-handed parallel beta-helix repeat-containing protein [Flavobacteriales bacterium]
MRMLRHPWVLLLLLVAAPAVLVAQPPMVTKYLHEFDTLGSGHPNDLINDQPALLKAAAFFQARGGYGTLVLEDGEYIVGLQQLYTPGSPLPGPDWINWNYPEGSIPGSCPSLVALQPGFRLDGCAQFTVQGGSNTRIRYRDCLYYGSFFRVPGTDDVLAATGIDSCYTCQDSVRLFIVDSLVHAKVGAMFTFAHCDSVTVRDVELDGNIDGALLGGKSSWDGIQTDYDGIAVFESSHTTIENVNAHHFGRDGLVLWGKYADTATPFADAYPDLHVDIDPADSATILGNRTVLFNNRILSSQFNWNGRQGFSWTALAGLTMSGCDLNYNGCGRWSSSPGAGLDIEGIGGPLRVRHGLFTDCRFLHNYSAGILSDQSECIGQQGFTFIDCTVKAGEAGLALWVEARDMEFHVCAIYGYVDELFEQAENLPRDPDFDLLFRKTDFYEEDDDWSYLKADPLNCGGGPHKLDLVGGGRAKVTFDSCGFYTNCHGMVRLKGRSNLDSTFTHCPTGSTGICIGPECTQQDARYVTATHCTFVNTGRERCTAQTQVLAVDHATVTGLTINIPYEVRNGGPGDMYVTPFGTDSPPCWPTYCYADTVILTSYGGNFPPCKPFYDLPDTIDVWDPCTGINLPIAPCVSDASCYASTVIPDSAFASLVGDVFIGTVNIKGRFFVDVDVLFQNAEVRLEPGAEIIVQNGWTLDIENSSFTACNGVMWKSITAEDGATMRIRGSFMDDAESAVSALDGSTVWIDGTQFHNNRVGLGIPDVGLPYNNVACWVSNSTFYSAGAMPLPYPGQTSTVGHRGFAAFDVHRTTLDLAGGHNTLHTLSNGIVAHQSDVQVSACRMFNIQPDSAYTLSGNGAGIFARGDQGFHFLRQQGYGMAGTPSFSNCRWGVFTEYMNVLSTDNRMLDMGTAHHVERSGYREVDIRNNAVTAHRHGMELRANDGAAHILVEGNDITFGDHPCANCKGYSGILVTEGNQQAHDARILNNSIHFTNAATSRFGIALTAADAWLVADNAVLLVSNAHNRTGIQLEGCRATEVSCNQISSSDTGYPIAAQSAIRNMMGSQPLISCNEMDRTANGILFNGVAYDTDVRGNFFHNHKWPLHLDATAIIGVQDHKGNLWDPAAIAPVWGALYEDTTNSVLNPFYYSPATISGGTTAPPSVWPTSGWFNVAPGANYDCADHHGEEYCSQFQERGEERLTELDLRIASDSLENAPYTDETKWMFKGRLYKKLYDNPDLQDSLQVMTDFYEDLQGSNTEAFKLIDDEQLHLYDLDSTVAMQLRQDYQQMEGLMDLVKDAMEQLGDSTLTAAQQQAILTGIIGYRESIRDLSVVNSVVLQAASASKGVTADGVKAANTTVTTSELIEENEKTVNDIYLATVGKDLDSFTVAQAASLFDIANQCPMLGGNAVFKARSLYWLIDDTYDFDDAVLCLPYGIIVKSLTESPINSTAVIPNPASDEATLVLERPLDAPSVFVVYDALGGELMRHSIPLETSRFVFTTASLAPAPYHYQVRGPLGVIGNGKLTIVR